MKAKDIWKNLIGTNIQQHFRQASIPDVHGDIQDSITMFILELWALMHACWKSILYGFRQ